MANLIDNIEKPTDDFISSVETIKRLEKRGYNQETIKVIKKYMQDNGVIDYSGYSGNTTLIVPNNELCIKISEKKTSLYNEKILYDFFSSNQLAPSVIEYISSEIEVLITEKIDGNMAIDEFKNLKDLAIFMGKSLRKFHDLSSNLKKEPLEQQILQERSNNLFIKALDNEVGLDLLASFLRDKDYYAMKKYLNDNKEMFLKDDVIVHGDWNPRNIFSNNLQFAGFIDFSETSFGDRHIDIIWGMWTTVLYLGMQGEFLKEKECEKYFLNAYGLDKIDFKRLELCKKLTCMYWQEHNDIYKL